MADILVKRKVDGLGRIHIPTAIRKELGIQEGDKLTLEKIGEEVIIYKEGCYCTICRKDADKKVNGEYICNSCIEEIKNMGVE